MAAAAAAAALLFILKRNNRDGQHRLQIELQESGDSADNQNTGTCASVQLNKGLDGVQMSASEHHRGEERSAEERRSHG